MAEDSEKRFQSIMDKLFHAPKSSSNPSGSSGAMQLARGKKRANPESALALVEPKTRGRDMAVAASQRSSAPLCRPWDRGDLMRRLATFKSMTWFAKPKVVSAVNCARRGWVNLDMDIIGCESCGARLLFASPSSWSLQQVEKAALVFSLKLDNGHKLLCPWIDNACDERLVEFPPTPPPVLVDKFKERSSALLQLLALPVISSAAIEFMRSPQLEEFLRQSSTLDFGNGSANVCQTESLGNGAADSASLYYQAQNLISLCGWEPRALPYIVDCKDRPKQLHEDAEILNSSHIVTNGHNPSVTVNSVAAEESVGVNEDSSTLGNLHADPSSVVLDCRLCGASVGLWTFSMVPRPVELFRLVGYTDVNSKRNSGQDSGNENNVDDRAALVNSAANGMLSSTDRPSDLKLTIAGGPPPTKQNFKATISLPIIGQNLRARLSYDSDFRDRTYDNQEVTQSGYENKNRFLEEKVSTEYNFSEPVSQPEAVGQLKSNTDDQGQCSYASSKQSACLNLETSEKDGATRKENNACMSLEGTDVNGQGTFPETVRHDATMECPMQSTLDIVQGLDQNDWFLEIANSVESFDAEEGGFGSTQVSASSVSVPDATITPGNEKSCENNSLVMIAHDNCDQQQILGAGISCVNDVTHNIDSRAGEKCAYTQNLSGAQAKGQEGIKAGVQIPVSSEVVAFGTGKGLKQLTLDKAMEFDPIRQHRHFCPWIVSTSSGAPGWQQTLSALQRQKDHSHPSTNLPPSASIIKVDDPIASVRKLFMSPSAKKMKPACRSS